MKKIVTLLSLLVSFAVSAQNVGIGTTNPTQQLDVNGNLRVRNLGNSTGQTSSMVQVDAEGVLKLAKIDTVRANPTPTLLGSAATGNGAASDYPIAMAANKNKLCVVNYISNTIDLFDVSAAIPVLLGTTTIEPAASGFYVPADVAISGDKAYVITQQSSVLQTLRIFDISGNVPVLTGWTAIEDCWRIIIRDTKAYVSTHGNKLLVYDLNGSTPSLLGSTTTGIGPRDFVLVGTKAYVINQSPNAMQVFDISSNNPVLLTTANTGTQPWAITSDGVRIYVANRGSQSIEVFEISGAQPVSVGATSVNYQLERIQLSGSRAYVIGDNNLLNVYDIAGRLKPVLIGSAPFSNPAATGKSLAINGRKAFVGTSDKKVQAFDLGYTGGVTAQGPDGNLLVIPDATIGGDNLGDHNITQNLNLRNFQLVGNEGTAGIGIANDGTVTTAKGLNVGGNINLGTNQLVGGGSSGLLINSNGHVGIGNVNPLYRLDITGNSRIAGDFIHTSADPNGTWSYLTNTSATPTGWKFVAESSPSAGVGGSLSIKNSINTTALTVQQNGNIGVGISNPSAAFTNVAGNITGSTGVGLGTGSFAWQMNTQGFTQALNNVSSAPVANGLLVKIAGTAASNRLLELSLASGSTVLVAQGDGKVGIGTNSPSQVLSVVGNITATGTITSSSDIRFKRDVQPLNNALSSVLQIQPIYYYWKKEAFPSMRFGTERQLGFNAQEIEQLFPELVLTDAAGYKSVDYSRLTPVLVQAVKEQQARIEKQEQTLELLLEEVKALKRQLVK